MAARVKGFEPPLIFLNVIYTYIFTSGGEGHCRPNQKIDRKEAQVEPQRH